MDFEQRTPQNAAIVPIDHVTGLANSIGSQPAHLGDPQLGRTPPCDL